MRNTLLASTALAFALAVGGAAMAAEDMKSGQGDGTTMERSSGTSGTMGSGTTGGSAGATMESDAQSYRSLNKAGDFSGPIGGGFQADELIGTDVVDANGDTVGEIADVLIDSQGNANHVLVDVGGFLGIGAKRVALSIDELSKQGEELTTSMTQEELEQLASYEEEGDNWMRVQDSDQTGGSGSTPGATTPSTGTGGSQ